MKKTSLAFLCTCFCLLFALSITAQDVPQKTDAPKAIEEEEGPIMFKFEPDFINHNEKRKTEIALRRKIIGYLSYF